MKLKLFIKSVFVFGLLCTGFSTSAVGVASVDKANTYVKPVALEYTQTLRRGIKNAHVYDLQKKLKDLGYYYKELDSDYGSGTMAAVIAFQNKHGLKPDGVAGPKTFAKILGIKLVHKKDVAVCTIDYSPVCGQLEVNCIQAPCDQPVKTFSNKCNLNAVGAKYLYSGECNTEKPTEESKIKPCTKEYKPVCGVKKEFECSHDDGEKECRTVYSDKKTFSNKCLMYAAGAEFKHFGTCGDQKEYHDKPEYSDKEKEEKIKYIQEKIAELQKLLKELQ